MTDQERNTKSRHAALRQYMISYTELVGEEHEMDDDELIAHFHAVLHADMEVVSKEIAWEEPPTPDEVGN